MIIGVGIDLVDVERFRAHLEKTPKLIDRLFTTNEKQHSKPERLAARFAAKEAFVKAIQSSQGYGYQDIEVIGGVDEAPTLIAHGGAKEAMQRVGATGVLLSMSHDGGFATAIVTLVKA